MCVCECVSALRLHNVPRETSVSMERFRKERRPLNVKASAYVSPHCIQSVPRNTLISMDRFQKERRHLNFSASEYVCVCVCVSPTVIIQSVPRET